MSKKATANLEIVSNENEEFVLDSRLTCKQVIIVTSNEGGVLKSTIADKIASEARARGFRVAFYDGDSKNAYGNHQKYQTQSSDDPLTGCQSFDVDENPEVIINAADIKADLILIDLGANKMQESVLGFGRIDKFFKTFNQSVQCTFAIPLSNDKCPRSFETIYGWLEEIDASKLKAPVRVVSVINTGFMEGNKDLLTKTMTAYKMSDALKSIKSEKDKFEFIEVEQNTQYDSAGLVRTLLKTNSVESARKIQGQQSRVVRFILDDHFEDAENLLNSIIK